MQRAEFETKLNRSCLHIYKEAHYEEDYQMPMLLQNRLDGILEVEGCEMDGRARSTYEISGLTSMKTMYENASIKKREIEAVIARILEVTDTLQRYMLDPNCLVLKPEYIFHKEGQWFFCYFPGMEEDLCKIFHELTEYFVKMLDYEDTEGIFLAYELHKATLQEHYDLELIMKEYKGRESERKKLIMDKPKPARAKRENKGTIRRIPAPPDEDEKEEFSYGSHGNIFSVTDEEEPKSEQSRFTYGKSEELYSANMICEEKTGGWWKSWRKAANGIRRKRWGSWDDLILETDGQEEES